jgi:hypothetical protein
MRARCRVVLGPVVTTDITQGKKLAEEGKRGGRKCKGGNGAEFRLSFFPPPLLPPTEKTFDTFRILFRGKLSLRSDKSRFESAKLRKKEKADTCCASRCAATPADRPLSHRPPACLLSRCRPSFRCSSTHAHPAPDLSPSSVPAPSEPRSHVRHQARWSQGAGPL